MFDALTQEEIKKDEKEADDLALLWFNDYLKSKAASLPPITMKEVREAQAEINNSWSNYMKNV